MEELQTDGALAGGGGSLEKVTGHDLIIKGKLTGALVGGEGDGAARETKTSEGPTTPATARTCGRSA